MDGDTAAVAASMFGTDKDGVYSTIEIEDAEPFDILSDKFAGFGDDARELNDNDAPRFR